MSFADLTWTFEELVVCDCGQRMLPNVSTADDEGVAWICTTPHCSEFTGGELEPEDLEAVGISRELAVVIASLADVIAEYEDNLLK